MTYKLIIYGYTNITTTTTNNNNNTYNTVEREKG